MAAIIRKAAGPGILFLLGLGAQVSGYVSTRCPRGFFRCGTSTRSE